MSGSQRKGGRTSVVEGALSSKRPARTTKGTETLERKAEGEVLDELLLMELELLRRYKAHLAAQQAEQAMLEARKKAAPETPAKNRIVRALRKLQ